MVALLGIITIAGSCAGSLNGSAPTTEETATTVVFVQQRRDLYQQVVRSAQAVVRVTGIVDRGDTTTVLQTEFRVLEVDVGEVLWLADAPSVPVVRSGDRIQVVEGVTPVDAVLPVEIPEEAIMILNAVDHTSGTSGQEWTVDWLARALVVDRGDRMEFLGPLAAGPPPFDVVFAALWDAVRGSQVTASADRQLDLLIDFIIEADAGGAAFDDPADPGPITTAYQALRRTDFARVASWFDLDPLIRPLDADTPASVLATLTTTPVFITIETTAIAPGAFLVIRTPLGVSHVAEVAAGSHPANLLGHPDDPWSVTIEWFAVGDAARVPVPVAEIGVRERSGVAGGLTIGDSVASASITGDPVPLSDVWRPLTREEFAALLAESGG